MSSTSARILKVIFSSALVSFPLATFAQDCLKNMDATSMQARAVLRAHNCELSPSMRECEMHLGIGSVSAIFLATGLGGRVAMEAFDPTAGVCAIAKHSMWIETAYAKACESPENHVKVQLGLANERLIEKYEKALTANAAEAEKINIELGLKKPDLEPLAEAKRQADENLKKAMAEATGSSSAVQKAADLHREQIAETEGLIKKYTGRSVNNDRFFEQIRDPSRPLPYGLTRQQADQIVASYDQTMRVAKMHQESKAQALATNPEIKKLKAEAEAASRNLQASSQTKVIPTSEKEKLKKRLAELTENRSALEKNHGILKELTGVLKIGNLTSPEDLQNAAEMLKAAGSKADQLTLTGLSNLAKKVEPVRGVEIHRFAKNAKVTSLKGGIIKGALGVMGVSAGFAQATETVAEAVDPVSRLLPQNKMDCGFEKRNNTSVAFPPSPDHKCAPNFKIDAENAKYLNADKDELKALIENDPKVCEFIQWNHRQYFSFTKATCTADGVNVQLRDGQSYQVTARKISFFQEATTQRPIEIEIDEDGNETLIRRPRAGGLKGSKNEAVTDLSRLNQVLALENKSEVYGTHRAALMEAKGCCSSQGVKPSTQECAKYGLNGSSTSGDSSSGVSSGTQ